MEKGYAFTGEGRKLVAEALATGVRVVWTRAVIGEGTPPEGTEYAAVTALSKPVNQAAMSVPVHKHDRVYITVEYRSDMNTVLGRGVSIAEFGIYAKLGTDGPETLMVYGCNGDYPIGVGPYVDGDRDIRRFPVTLVIGAGVPMDIGYSPDMFMTAEDIDEYTAYILLPALAARSGTVYAQTVTIPTGLWREDGSGYQADMNVLDVHVEQYPIVLVDEADFETAERCALSDLVTTREAGLVFHAARKPDADIHGQVVLLQPAGCEQIPVNGGWFVGDSGEGSPGVAAGELRPATTTRLGGVRIGPGIGITPDGTISVDSTAILNDIAATDAEIDEIMNDVLGDE